MTPRPLPKPGKERREPVGGQAGGRAWQGSLWEEGHWRGERKEGGPRGREDWGLELHLLWPCERSGGGAGGPDPCWQLPGGLGAALPVGGQGPSSASEVHGCPEGLWAPLAMEALPPTLRGMPHPRPRLGGGRAPQVHPAAPFPAPGSLRNWTVNDEVWLDHS